MDGLSSFIAMGGYGVFVWPSYGFAFLVLGALALQTLRRLRRAERTLATLTDSGRGRRGASVTGGGAR